MYQRSLSLVIGEEHLPEEYRLDLGLRSQSGQIKQLPIRSGISARVEGICQDEGREDHEEG